MPQLSTEDRKIVRHPALEYASVEIRTNDNDVTYAVNINRPPLDIVDLEKFADLINGVLEMEAERLSHLGDEAASAAELAEKDEVPA